MQKVVIVSGYFNPLHKGHIEYFNMAKDRGDQLFVIVNSDLQRALKGSKEFMNQDERLCIVQNLKMVDTAIISVDRDRTVCDSLRFIHSLHTQFPPCETALAFANGGDQNNDTIPESAVCKELGIELIDNLGKKIQSSSWLLKENANE
jgi:D-beta-D-heptose 7-phosphate kinase/D-beta-D-heptose 1-phosphate adenosyltransferase